MSYAVPRVQKFTAGSVKGIQIHDRREKEYSHSNPDIDFSRTKDNYDLHEQSGSYNQAVNKRIGQLDLTRAVRKDAIVMSQVLVTSDHSFFEGLDKEQQAEFFKKSYDFLADRYGKENIISATVHMDERTPHMHFNFVPVTADGRLSAKSLFTPKTLSDLHDKFYEQVGKSYGLERGEPKESGKRRIHLETAEYKEALKRAEKAQGEREHLEALKNAVQGKFEALEAKYRGVVISDKHLDTINPQSGLFSGTVKGVSLEDIENLKKTAISYVKLKHNFDDLREKYKKLRENYEDAKAHIPSLSERMEQGKNNARLEQLEKAFEKLPAETREQLFPEKSKVRDIDNARGR
jgi:hypothetical protein